MRALRHFFLFTFPFLLLSGCHIERIVLEEPVKSQFVEVDTEDHVVVRLNEDAARGYEWTATCDDLQVDMTIAHEPGEGGRPGLAIVHLHVERGFDGPSIVYLRYENIWSDKCVRKVRLQLHRRQTNTAGWR